MSDPTKELIFQNEVIAELTAGADEVDLSHGVLSRSSISCVGRGSRPEVFDLEATLSA
jgi:hypothetical protein